MPMLPFGLCALPSSSDHIPVADTMFADLPFLRGLIPALHAAGVVLAIATFGRRDVVLKFLEHALGPPLTYFSQISPRGPLCRQIG